MLDALWVRTGGYASLGLKVWLLGDRRLCLVIMQKPRPQKKRGRKRAPTEMPSSATQEVIQVVQKGTRIVKKRVIEKIEFDSRPSPSPFSGGGPPDTLGSQADPPQPPDEQDTPKQPPPGGKSRSVSVSPTHLCHVDTRSPFPEQHPGLASRPGQVPS